MADGWTTTGTDTYTGSGAPNKIHIDDKYPKVATGTTYTFLQMRSPVPKGAPVIVTTLRGRVRGSGWAASRTLTLKPLAAGFNSKTKDANKPGTLSSNNVSITVAGKVDGDEIVFVVTGWAQAVANGQANHGWRIESTGGSSLFYGFDSKVDSWRLEAEWSDDPDQPSNLNPANEVISIDKPVLTFDYADITGTEELRKVQVQINATNVFTAPSFDSGWVNSLIPQLDLATTAYAGLALNASAWWRVRVEDESGQQSPWSDAVQITRTAKPTPTVTNPAVVSPYWTNTARNPSFETNVTGMSTSNVTLTRTSAWASPDGGGWSALVAVNTVPASTYISELGPLTAPNNNRHAAVAGDKVSWRGRFKAIRNIAVRCSIQPYDSAGAGIGGLLTGPTVQLVAGQEQVIERNNVVMPAGTAAYLAYFHLFEYGTTSTQVQATGDAVYVDSIAYINNGPIDLAVPMPYFDGSSPNTDLDTTTWAGTAHQSSSILARAVLWDPTPEIIGSITGGTLSAYRIIIAKGNDKSAELYNVLVPATGTTISHEVPAKNKSGKQILGTSGSYWLGVQFHDTVANRGESPGDPIYAEVWRKFTVDVNAATTPVSSLTVTQVGSSPAMTFAWVRASGADKWALVVDGKVVQVWENEDLSISGTSYTGTWWGATGYDSHTYAVRAVTNGLQSADGPVVTKALAVEGLWLIRSDGSMVVLEGTGIGDWQQLDRRGVYKALNSGVDVDVVSAIEGISGPFKGTLSKQVDQDRDTARALLRDLKSNPVEVVHIAIGELCFPARLRNLVVDIPAEDYLPNNRKNRVEFTCAQAGDVPYGVG